MSASQDSWFDLIRPEERFHPLRCYFTEITRTECCEIFLDTSDETTWTIFDQPHRLLAKIFFRRYADILRGQSCSASPTSREESWISNEQGLSVTSQGYINLPSGLISSDAGSALRSTDKFTPERFIECVNALPDSEKKRVIALYLNDCDILSSDFERIAQVLSQFPALRHINLCRTRLSFSESLILQLAHLMENEVIIDIRYTPLASIDGKEWFSSSSNFTLKCAEHLLWIPPSVFRTDGWIHILNRPDLEDATRSFHMRWIGYKT
jgi:hypothetical protein